MKIQELILEVRVLDGINTVHKGDEPLKDSDTVRVYHGFNSKELLKWILVNGISGDAKIFRRYAYENNNNPRGIFVTTNLKTARTFGDYVVEFHTRVSDLEAPVWPSGSYTVQGGKEEYWADENERTVATKKLRKESSKSRYKTISDSDRPEVAKSLLMSSENQALFVGNLNPNSIRAVWVDGDRKTRQEAAELFRGGKKEDRVGTPRDKITVNDLVLHYNKDAKNDEDEYKFILTVLAENPDYVYRKVWNRKQWRDIVAELKGMGYDVSAHNDPEVINSAPRYGFD